MSKPETSRTVARKRLHTALLTACLAALVWPMGCKDESGGGGSGVIIKADGVYTSPDGKATLTVSGPSRVLKLEGTRYEMGYNHGYLLAGEIVTAFQRYVLLLADIYYEDVRDALAVTEWGADTEDELDGMLDGIEDALSVEQRTVKPLGEPSRPIDLMDLKAVNSLPDWGWMMGCSSFSIWGAGRNDGSTLLARNMDYYVDPDGVIGRSHIIISYDYGGTRFVNVGVVGFIGCLTCMNEDGVCGMMHDTNAYDTSDDSGFVPRGIALRSIIESFGPSDTPADAEIFLDLVPSYYGNNFHFAFPSAGRTDDETAGIVEYDGWTQHADGRATLRSPSDNPSLSMGQDLDYEYALINTNHYLERNESMTYGDSFDRYLTIRSGLDLARADGHVDLDEALEIMADVGASSSTLHTVLFEPDTGKLHIFLSEGSQGAYDCAGHDYDFDELF